MDGSTELPEIFGLKINLLFIIMMIVLMDRVSKCAFMNGCQELFSLQAHVAGIHLYTNFLVLKG